MSEEPSQKSFLSFFSNLFSKEKNNSNKTIETPDDEQIEELIQNVLKIKDAIVREIMIPKVNICLLYTSPSPRDQVVSRMPSSA